VGLKARKVRHISVLRRNSLERRTGNLFWRTAKCFGSNRESYGRNSEYGLIDEIGPGRRKWALRQDLSATSAKPFGICIGGD
jgi:hypothetical protein